MGEQRCCAPGAEGDAHVQEYVLLEGSGGDFAPVAGRRSICCDNGLKGDSGIYRVYMKRR